MAARTKASPQTKAGMPIEPTLFLLDRHGVVTGWTGAGETITGYEAPELHGMGFDRLFATAAPGGIAAALRTARRNLRFNGSGWLGLKDGSTVQTKLVIEPLQVSAGRTEGFAATIGDLVARQQSDGGLAESEHKFRMLVQGVIDYAIYMIDPQGYITNWNLGGERIKGYTAEEIIGQHFSRFYAPEDRAADTPARALAI